MGRIVSSAKAKGIASTPRRTLSKTIASLNAPGHSPTVRVSYGPFRAAFGDTSNESSCLLSRQVRILTRREAIDQSPQILRPFLPGLLRFSPQILNLEVRITPTGDTTHCGYYSLMRFWSGRVLKLQAIQGLLDDVLTDAPALRYLGQEG